MPPVPSLPGERIVRALERTGFKVARVRGSHHIMRHPDGRGTTVPVHPGRDVAKGTLRGILSDVGMSISPTPPGLTLTGGRSGCGSFASYAPLWSAPWGCSERHRHHVPARLGCLAGYPLGGLFGGFEWPDEEVRRVLRRSTEHGVRHPALWRQRRRPAHAMCRQ
jgi:predicted RNA binding protein YcfA (HicA-like mRNA interferase family)